MPSWARLEPRTKLRNFCNSLTGSPREPVFRMVLLAVSNERLGIGREGLVIVKIGGEEIIVAEQDEPVNRLKLSPGKQPKSGLCAVRVLEFEGVEDAIATAPAGAAGALAAITLKVMV